MMMTAATTERPSADNGRSGRSALAIEFQSPPKKLEEPPASRDREIERVGAPGHGDFHQRVAECAQRRRETRLLATHDKKNRRAITRLAVVGRSVEARANHATRPPVAKRGEIGRV